MTRTKRAIVGEAELLGDPSDADDDDEIDLTFTPHTTVRANLARAFGISNQFGQTLGMVLDDVQLVDGALYVDEEKEKYKLFSWSDVAGLSPVERLERGQEPDVDDAPLVESKTYGTTDKTYELVAARVESIVEDDGDVLVDSSSMIRDAEWRGGSWSFGDFEHHGGGVIDIGSTITWWSANEEYGPSTSSTRVAELITDYGEEIVVDDTDQNNWLRDTTGTDILRDDLDGREVEFWLDIRTGDSGRNYHYPIMVDADTGAQIAPNNTGGEMAIAGGSGNESAGDDSTESETVQLARELDAGSQPEPVADFIRSGESLSLDESRATTLLTELINDPDNGMTEEMVEEAGGKDALVQRVIEA